MTYQSVKSYRQVKTTNTSPFDDGNGRYFVMSPGTVRTWTDHAGAIEHATNLIRDNNGGEDYLVVKVVGRVRKKPVPVEYVEIKD